MSISKLIRNQELKQLICKLRENFPSTIVAGGVIRDLYHNKPVHDIDIYVHDTDDDVYDSTTWKDEFKLSTSFLTEDFIRVMGGDDDGYEGKNHIGAVWEIQKDGTLYNVIVVEVDPIKYVTEWFDIGLCKAYCDGTKIRLTADFLHDSRNKKLTIVSEKIEEEEFWNIMHKHVIKLQSKYPNHSLVVPPMYQEWYDDYLKNK